MNWIVQLKTFVKQLKNKVSGKLGWKVPQGMTEFNTLANFIIETYHPACDDKSTRFIIATLLMRLEPTQDKIQPESLGKALRAGAARQVGAAVMEQIKADQKAAEVTAQAGVTSNGQSVPN